MLSPLSRSPLLLVVALVGSLWRGRAVAAQPLCAAWREESRAHPDNPRDWLASGVVETIPEPALGAPSTAPSRALLDALRTETRALQEQVLSAGSGVEVTRALRALRQRGVWIDREAAALFASRNARDTVEGLVLQAQAHEHLAGQCAHAPAVMRPTRVERLLDRAAEASLRCLALRLASREPTALVCPPRPAVRVTPDRETVCHQELGLAYDQLAWAHRRVAILLYATALHFADAHRLFTAFVWFAREHLRDEENHVLLDEVLRYTTQIVPRPGLLDAPTPGLNLLEPNPRFAPGLARE